jgi:hypothetical protein
MMNLLGLPDPEDESTVTLEDISKYLPFYMV